ncbi:hypothetical protein E2320_000161 [Naja naja]|nr:hypothetical protein E2320_000161 [Naja naja]
MGPTKLNKTGIWRGSRVERASCSQPTRCSSTTGSSFLALVGKSLFLRRTKDELQKKKKPEHPNHLPENQSEDVAPVMPSLPRKNEFIVWVFLAPVQEEIYRNFISLEHIKELLLSTRSPLAELTILKKLCDHPRLLSNQACSQLGLEASNDSEKVGENEPSELPDMKRSIEHVSDEMLIQESGKLSVLGCWKDCSMRDIELWCSPYRKKCWIL